MSCKQKILQMENNKYIKIWIIKTFFWSVDKIIIFIDTPVKTASGTTIDKQQQFWLPLMVNDTMDFVKAGFETICEDDVNQVMISAQVGGIL